MARIWGKLNEGQTFQITATDLDRAIAHTHLGRYEAMILQYVREEHWGRSARKRRKGEPWPDAAPCVVPVRELSRRWEVSYQRLVEAKRNLLNRLIILEDDNDPEKVVINKQPEMWAGLSPASLKYAREAVAPGTENRSTPERNNVPCVERKNVPRGTLDRSTPERRTVPNGTLDRSTTVVPPRPPIDEAGARSEERDLIQTFDPGAHAHAREDVLFDPDGAAKAAPGEEPDADLNRRHADLKRIMDAAREAWGIEGESWAARFGHEYVGNVDAALWAIREVRAVFDAGGSVRSFGGLVQLKFRDKISGRATPTAATGRPMTDAERAKADKQARVAEIYRRRRAERERQESESAGAAALKPGA